MILFVSLLDQTPCPSPSPGQILSMLSTACPPLFSERLKRACHPSCNMPSFRSRAVYPAASRILSASDQGRSLSAVASVPCERTRSILDKQRSSQNAFVPIRFFPQTNPSLYPLSPPYFASTNTLPLFPDVLSSPRRWAWWSSQARPWSPGSHFRRRLTRAGSARSTRANYASGIECY